jgi:hypothetical protein
MIDVRMRRFIGVVAAIAGLVTAACDDSTTEPEDTTPQISSMNLYVGTDTVSIDADGVVTGDPLQIEGTMDITAEFLDSLGVVAVDASTDPYELQVTSADETVVTFTLTDGFTGTLEGLLSGESTTVDISLYDTEQAMEVFGPLTVTVEVL